MSVFHSFECSAGFTGPPAEAADARSLHTADHGRQLASEKARPSAQPRALGSSMQEEIFHTFPA